MKKFFLVIGLLFSLTLFAPARSFAADLDKVLAQMDAASAKFRNAQADFVWDNYTKVVDDHEKQSGTIYFDRTGGQTQMAALIQQPEKKTVVYKGSKLYFYQPAIDQLTIFNIGQNQSQYESFLTLGFGGSGKDLATTWDIADLGPETIDGAATEKLDLKGKQENVRKMFDHVTIWVDPARAVTLRQQFFYTSGDMRTCFFTAIKQNGKLTQSAFEVPKAKSVIQK